MQRYDITGRLPETAAPPSENTIREVNTLLPVYDLEEGMDYRVLPPALPDAVQAIPNFGTQKQVDLCRELTKLLEKKVPSRALKKWKDLVKKGWPEHDKQIHENVTPILKNFFRTHLQEKNHHLREHCLSKKTNTKKLKLMLKVIPVYQQLSQRRQIKTKDIQNTWQHIIRLIAQHYDNRPQELNEISLNDFIDLVDNWFKSTIKTNKRTKKGNKSTKAKRRGRGRPRKQEEKPKVSDEVPPPPEQKVTGQKRGRYTGPTSQNQGMPRMSYPQPPNVPMMGYQQQPTAYNPSMYYHPVLAVEDQQQTKRRKYSSTTEKSELSGQQTDQQYIPYTGDPLPPQYGGHPYPTYPNTGGPGQMPQRSSTMPKQQDSGWGHSFNMFRQPQPPQGRPPAPDEKRHSTSNRGVVFEPTTPTGIESPSPTPPDTQTNYGQGGW